MSLTRIKNNFNLLDVEYIRKLGILDPNKFIRNRKMNFKDYIYFIINNKGKTLSLELDEYMEKSNKTITKQAFSKQRQNINPEIFRVLNEAYVQSVYDEKDIKKFKNYIVLGVDGSKIELPNNDKLKAYYGISQGREKSVGRVRANAIGIYDCLNNLMIKSKLDPYNVSEKSQIEKELNYLKEFYKDQEIIIVCDRLYFGISFINTLDKMGIKYLIRMQNKHYKKEKVEMKTNDEIVNLKIRTNSVFYAETEEEKEELKKLGFVKTRIIKTMVNDNLEEHLSTNLSKEELSEEEAKSLYFGRWEIEKAFDVIKNKINIENISSYTVIGVEQDFYSQILLYNMLEDVRSDADIQKKKTEKYDYKVNMNILVGRFRKKFYEIVLEENPKKRNELEKKFMNSIRRSLIPIKPNRNFERNKMHSMNKYRHNLRRNC